MRLLRGIIQRARGSSLKLALILGIVLPLAGSGTQAQSTQSRPPFRYGVVVSDSKYYPEVTKMGFGYIKLFVSWKDIESSPGNFGGFPDSAVNTALANHLQIVALVFDTPTWANGTGSYNPNNPPPTAGNVAEFGNFMGVVAAHYKGRIAAYEIWNEENVIDTWGGQNPDVGRYVSMLQAAYPKIKAGDPNALVISGGVANTGDGNPNGSAIGDLTYLREMLQGGALGNVDAIGIHPYPGPCVPEATSCPQVPGTYFQRAVDEHNAVAPFSSTLPLWITEAGYFSKPSAVDPTAATCDNGPGIGGFNRYEVDETTKANDLVDAYNYAYNNWPWLGMFILENLDLIVENTKDRAQCDPVRFFGILTAPQGPSGAAFEGQAYVALKNMPKFVPTITVAPPPAGGYPETDGTVTITGKVSDPADPSGLTIQSVTTTIDTMSGPTSSLARTTISPDGTFTIVVDVRSLTMQSHEIYVAVDTVQDGTLTASTSVQVKRLVEVQPSTVTFKFDPNIASTQTATVTFLRNDNSSQSFTWNVSFNPTTTWLTVKPAPSGSGAVFTATTNVVTPGIYQTTATIAPTGSPVFANQITVPVVLVDLDLPFKAFVPEIGN